MKLNVWTVLLLLTLFGSTNCMAQVVPPLQVVRLASDEWCPYVCVENGRISGGFFVEVVQQAMRPAGYRIEPVLLPFTRAVNETISGHIDGLFSPSLDPRIIKSNPLFYSRSCFYTLKNQHWTYRGIDSLAAISLGVIHDYDYDDATLDAYIEKNHRNKALIDRAYGEFAGLGNLRKLLAGRFMVLVEDAAVMPALTRQLSAGELIRMAGCMETAAAVTVGFNIADPRSAAWIKALNAGVQQLEASGKLQALRLRYNIPLIKPVS